MVSANQDRQEDKFVRMMHKHPKGAKAFFRDVDTVRETSKGAGSYHDYFPNEHLTNTFRSFLDRIFLGAVYDETFATDLKKVVVDSGGAEWEARKVLYENRRENLRDTHGIS